MSKDHIYHPPIPEKPRPTKIEGHTITPARALALAEECEASKGFDADGLVNEQAAGQDKYCRWVLMAFPKGEWAKFKAFLLDLEKYGNDLLADLEYYRGVLQEIQNRKNDDSP